MHLEPVNLLHVVYLFLTLFGLVLVRHAGRFQALSLLLALQAALMVFNLLEETDITRHYYLVTPIFTLGFGPAIFLFVRQLTLGAFPRAQILALHCLPMLLALPFTAWPQAVIAVGSVSQVCYLTAAILLVRRYHAASLATRSDAHQLRLDWLLLLLGIFLLMMLQDLVRQNLQPFAPLWMRKNWYLLNTAIEFSLTAYLITKAVRQPEVYDGLAATERLQLAAICEVDEKDPQAVPIFAEIDQQVRQGELFKQARLSLRDLADVSRLNEKTLSWAINQGAGKGFCDYINGLRVEALCRELQAQPASNLLDLALAMGFGSKSTFNSVFKKETGLTPSEYLRLHQSS